MRSFELASQETPFIAHGQTVEGIDQATVFTQTAFALQEGEVSRPTLIGNRYVVMKLLERKATYIPSFEEVKANVREALEGERSHALARQKANELLHEVKTGKSLAELAEALNTQVEQTGLVSRNSTIPKLGQAKGFIREAFRMGVGEAGLIDLLGQPAVVVLKERQEFDAAAYEKDKAQVRQRVLRQKRDQTFAQWSNDLRREAEERRQIAVNQNLLAML